TSPHGQNIVVELDEKMKPTGRIIIRDLDYYIDGLFFDQLPENVKPKTTVAKLFKGEIQDVQFHFLEDQQLPEWVSREQFMEIAKTYLSSYANEFHHITGVPAEQSPLLGYDVYEGSIVPVDKMQEPSGYLVLKMSELPKEEYMDYINRRVLEIQSPIKSRCEDVLNH
ncbi:MAG: hypothetical protein KDD34_08485, partial [Bdellovibrionales bacterium]|nr:hypothetical protein [Bdellovibrionales bacterium]